MISTANAYTARAALTIAAIAACVSGCQPRSCGSQPAATAAEKTDPLESKPRPIRIAMSAAFVSEAGVQVYNEIAHYLSGEIGREIEFITGFSYSTINAMLSSGAIDVGFVCGLPYVILHDGDHPAVDLLVAPVMKAERYQGKPKYFSDLIVRKDSDIESIDDLRGRTYVYNEEISNSGYNLPRYRLLKLGYTGGFFAKVLRSGSHEESIRMVAKGSADASFVDSLVLEYDLAYGLGVAGEVRVVESVGPAGIPPVVVSRHLAEDLATALQKHMLAMHQNPAGRAILDKALVDRFVAVDDSNYDDIRAMKEAAETAGFSVIR